MENQANKSDWRSILVLVFSLGSIALFFMTAISALVMMFLNERFPAGFPKANASPLSMALLASAMIAMGALLAPAAWLSLKRLRGQEFNSFQLPALRVWAWIAVPGLWIIAMAIATIFHDARGAHWFVPLMHFLSIALPVYLIVRIGINRIPVGSSQRAWTVFGSGMTLSPILSMIGEGFALLLVLIPLGVYFGMNPDKMFNLQRIGTQLENGADLESMLYQFEPFIMDPLILLAVLALLAVLVPIIEETFKSIGVWLVSDRLTSPAQGFALGLLSGAGFALSESLFATIAPDDSWAAALSMRAFSGSMHMLASGLVGWGIAYARLEKRYSRLFGLTMLAMLLHGLWNTGAILTAAGGLRAMVVIPDIDIPGTIMALGGAGLLFVLISGTLIALFLLNRKLRTPEPTPVPDEPVGVVG